MKVAIFYTNENVRHFYNDETVLIASYVGGKRELTEEVRSFEKHYTEVSSPSGFVANASVEEILDEMFMRYNHNMARVVSDDIKSGKIKNVGHSSMSVGDIIQVNEDYYIVQGIGFTKFKIN